LKISIQKFVFQEASTIPWRTVERDVALGLELRDLPKDKIRKKVQKMIELIGLTGFEKFYPIHLSEGLRQRAAIARAFVTDPNLLLMDEPFGQLDTSVRYDLESSLVELWEKRPRRLYL